MPSEIVRFVLEPPYRMANTLPEPTRKNLLLAAIVASLFLISCGKRVDPAPKPQTPQPFEFLNSWGDKGDGPGKLHAAVAFTVDVLGNVFFADPGVAFIHKFESKGTPLFSFEDSRLRQAAGIAVDSGGAIYAGDPERGTVFIFFPDGTFLRALRMESQKHFSGSFGIAIDEMGHICAPHAAKQRVLVFDNRGRILESWPAPMNPASPAERPSSIAVASDGSILVAYFSTGRIERFASDSSWMTTWAATNHSPGESSPLAGFTVAGAFVYTIAASSAEIRVWTLEGQHFLDADLGDHLGSIGAPQIAVTPRSELLVFDPAASKVFRFRIHLEKRATNDLTPP